MIYTNMDNQFNVLTEEEKRVIVEKQTEPPFSGQYDNFFKDGIYICKRCNSPLYKSDSKFDAHCGWPSFDEAIPGAITKVTDPDGVRTETICNKCGAHLGHVFEGENFTPNNVRFCINSMSLKFIPKKND